MRIDHLIVENFKGFERREFDFHPQFNLIVGENGSGKTSVLDALAVAAGSWLLGIPGEDSRHIRQDDVRLISYSTSTTVNWEQQYPCVVEARGTLDIGWEASMPDLGPSVLSWRRVLAGPGGRTTRVDANDIKQTSESAVSAVRRGQNATLPLISYYGTGRLWDMPRDQTKFKADRALDPKISRLAGYKNSVDPRLSVAALVEWIGRQSWVAFQHSGQETQAFSAVRAALRRNIHGARDILFDAQRSEVVVDFEDDHRQPFANLSDGQRCMLALVGDLAQKAATLNPHLGAEILTKTPGIVLIDELDLHLHPKWQRHVIEDLRTTFPKLQFVCTTHSPFLIQSLRSGEELLMLDGQAPEHLWQLSIDTIANGIQEVPPGTSARYEEMQSVATDYLKLLEEAAQAPNESRAAYESRLADAISPFADNPAFQAILEFQRAAKLGS